MSHRFCINNRVVELATGNKGTVVETVSQQCTRKFGSPCTDKPDDLVPVHWDHSNSVDYIHPDLIGVIAAVTMPNYTSSKIKRLLPHVH